MGRGFGMPEDITQVRTEVKHGLHFINDQRVGSCYSRHRLLTVAGLLLGLSPKPPAVSLVRATDTYIGNLRLTPHCPTPTIRAQPPVPVTPVIVASMGGPMPVRRFPRYEASCPALALKTEDRVIGLRNISAGGACCDGEPTGLQEATLVCTGPKKCSRCEKLASRLQTHRLEVSGSQPNSPRSAGNAHVVQWAPTCQEQMKRVLEECLECTCIRHDPDVRAGLKGEELYETLLRVLSSLEKKAELDAALAPTVAGSAPAGHRPCWLRRPTFDCSRGDALRWLCQEELNGHRDQDCLATASPLVLLEVLEKAFEPYYISKDEFFAHFTDMLRSAIEEARRHDKGMKVICVPVRMPRYLSDEILGTAYNHARITLGLSDDQVEYIPSLDRFLFSEPTSDYWLVGIDALANKGQAWSHFLQLLDRRGAKALERSVGICLASVVGYSDAIETITHQYDGPREFRVVVGRQLEPKDRIFHDDFALEADTKALLKAIVRNRLISTSAFREVSRPNQKLGQFDFERAIPVTFYYGATHASLPLFWSDGGNWTPFCPRVQYYLPETRPLPRAPSFFAHPNTVIKLLDTIDENEPAVLTGPSGCGKSYVAAKAAQLRCASRYTLWHDCLPFHTIDTFLAHVDSFLADQGLDSGLRNLWGTALSVNALADGISDFMQRLDRDVLLVVDHLDRLFGETPSRDFDESATQDVDPCLRLLSCLADRFRSDPEDSGAPSVSMVLIAGSGRDGGVPNDTLARVFGGTVLEIPCPVQDDYDPENANLALACRKLLTVPDGAFSTICRNYLSAKAFISPSPIEVHLLCFYANRRDRRDMVEHGDGMGPSPHDRFTALSLATHQGGHALLEESYKHKILDTEERELLECASAFVCPWKVSLLHEVCIKVGASTSSEATCEIIKRLLADRAPFLIPLDSAVLDLASSSAATERARRDFRTPRRLEMPSPFRSFFEKKLKDRDNGSFYRNVCRTIADVLSEEAEAQAVALAGNRDASQGWLLQAQQVHYYLEAQLPVRAAEVYCKTAQHLIDHAAWGWLRILGQRIMESADVEAFEDKTELFCKTAWNYAYCLIRIMRFTLACECCRDTLKKVNGLSQNRPSRLWVSRILQNWGRAERSRRRYEHSLHRLEEALAESEAAGQSSSDLDNVRITTHCALAQTHIARGNIDRSRDHLTRAQDIRSNRPSLNDSKIQRHLTTLSILNGDLEAAEESAKKMLSSAARPSDRMGEAISQYLSARVHIERARRLEILCAGESKDSHVHAGLQSHIRSAHTALSKAKAVLGGGLGDKWWNTVVLLTAMETHLLGQRAVKQGYLDTTSGASPDLADLEGIPLPKLLEYEFSFLTAISSLEDCMPRDWLLDARDAYVDLAQKIGQEFEAVHSMVGDCHPFLKARILHESAHFYSRLARGLRTVIKQGEDLGKRLWSQVAQVEGLASVALQRSNETLFKAGLFGGALLNCLLAEAAFRNSSWGLQDRLEASLWLGLFAAPDIRQRPVFKCFPKYQAPDSAAQSNFASLGDVLDAIACQVVSGSQAPAMLGDLTKLVFFWLSGDLASYKKARKLQDEDNTHWKEHFSSDRTRTPQELAAAAELVRRASLWVASDPHTRLEKHLNTCPEGEDKLSAAVDDLDKWLCTVPLADVFSSTVRSAYPVSLRDKEHYVMLIYCWKDEVAVKRLAELLREDGYCLWIDRDHCPGGAHVSRTIRSALPRATCVVCALGPHGVGDNQQKEIWAVDTTRVPLIPLTLPGLDAERQGSTARYFPESLTELNCISFENLVSREERAYQDLRYAIDYWYSHEQAARPVRIPLDG